MEGLRGSVIIPSWNSGDVLVRCLETLRRQELAGGFETIVVDNGSTDGTASLLRSHAGWVHAIANSHNLGYAAACNEGARTASGKILFFLNSDVELPERDTLERLATAAEQPGVGIAGPRLLNPDGTLQPSCAAHPSLTRSLVVAAGVHRVLPQAALEHFAPEFWAHDRPLDTGWLVGAALAVPAEVFDALGGFWSTAYAEDEDLAYRAQRRGLRVRFESGASVVHIGNHSAGKAMTDVQRASRVAQAELAFLRAHYPPARGRAIRAVVGAGYAARAVVHRLLGRNGRAGVFAAMAGVYARSGPP